MTLARISLFVAVALAALVTVPVAVGSKLPRGAHYEGTSDTGVEVTLRLSGDARRIARLRIDYVLKCDDGNEGSTYTVISNARLHGRRHRFRAVGSYTGSVDNSSNRFELAGRVSARGASGTFSLLNRSEGDTSKTCDSGKVRWRASRIR